MLPLLLVVATTLHPCPQRIEVTAPTAASTTATVSLLECGARVLGPFRARVGYAGLSTHHREGDGTTPIGTFRIGPTIYGLDPNPGTRLEYHRLHCGDWWDEDPASQSYNTFQEFPCGGAPPFAGGSEPLWRAKVAYRELAVVEYNTAPAIPGRGSGIFLHDDRGHPTEGCVSIPRPDLIAILRRLRSGATITIGVG